MQRENEESEDTHPETAKTDCPEPRRGKTKSKPSNITLSTNQHGEMSFCLQMDNMLEGYQIIDRDFRYLYVNDTAAKHARLPKEKLIGHTMMELFPGIEKTEVFGLISHCMQQECSHRLENKFTYPNGRYGWFDLIIQSIPEGVVVLSVDITERKRAEEALLEREILLNEVGNIASIGGWEMDMIKRTAKWTKATYDIVEIKYGDPIPGPDEHISYYLPEYQDMVQDAMTKLIEYDMPLDFEAELKTAKGNIKWCHALGKCYRENGKCVKVYGTFQDITERKITERKLTESESMFRLLFENSQDAILLTVPDGSILRANPAACQMFGRTEQEICQLDSEGIVDTTDPRLAMALATRRDTSAFNGELTFLRSDGTKFTGEISSKIFPDINGNLNSSMVIRDITERQRMANEVRMSEKRLRRVLENIPNVIALYDENLRIQYINRASRQITGRPAADFIGRRDDEIWPPEIYNAYLPMLKESFKTGKIRSLETELLMPTGLLSLNITCIPIQGEDGKARELVSIIHDLTEHKQAEESRRKVREYQELDNMKTNLLSTVSHELRTPLASIKGYSTLLLDYEERLNKEKKRESLIAIDKSSDRLAELIDRLLDMSRLDAGLFKLNIAPTNLRQIITTAIDEARLRVPEYNFTINIGRIPAKINIDKNRIRQIIDNLLENAVKYSKPGTTIAVEARRQDKEAIISISDQGVGIPKKELGKVFDRMYRLEQYKIKDHGGLGLGLSLCKALVEAHGGRIWAKSTIGSGSSFYFTLPI